MIKSVIKEILITILLVVAILLILGIIFYEYVPTSERIPSAVTEYKLPEEMTEELNETLTTTTQNLVQTYTVDGKDLSSYEATKDYEKGKPNPFAATSSGTTQNNNSTSNDSNDKTQSSTNSGSFLNEVK